MPEQRARAEQHASLVAAMVTALLMLVQQIGAKTTRDTLFLSHHPASELPMVMIGAAVLSLVGALTFSRVLQRVGPTRAVPFAYALHAAAFAGEWWFVAEHPFVVSIVVYLHMGALGPVIISGFWSLVNEQFDPHTAKKVVSRIAASAAFGGVLGGVASERVIATLDLTSMLPALAIVTLTAGLFATRVSRPSGPAPSKRTSDPGSPRPSSTRYLRDLATLVLVTSTTAGLLDYAMKAEAAVALRNPSDLGSFFAVFHAGVGVVVFLLQTFLSSRSLQKLGIAGTIALLPAAVLVGGVVSVAVTRLWTISLVNAFENVLRSSLYRSGYELLYTPVDKARKRAMKTLIDVGFDRLGDIAAAGLALAALAFLPKDTNQLVVGLGVVLAAWGLILSLRLHRGYVAELAASLRAGTLRVTDVDGIDATTQRTLTDTTMAMDREQLLEEIRALQARRPPLDHEAAAEGHGLDIEQQRLFDDARTLLSRDERAKRQLLERQLKTDGLPPNLIPLVIALLAERALARIALAVLQNHTTGREGVLVDALLDQREPDVVRRRIPRILRSLGTERARDGLLAGLDDPNFGVRYYCAQSLFRIVSQHPRLSPDRERIFALVAREAAVPREEWECALAVDEGDPSATIRSAQHRPAARLEYVFMLLSTILEAEPLELCLKAVVSGDLNLRGTALEYLGNVLPARVYSVLSKHLLSGAVLQKEKRKPAQIVQELHQSMSNLKLDIDLFRKESAQDER